MKTFALIAIGVVGGILGGMGLGGGTLLIPLMTLFAGVPQKTAAAINLIGFVPMAAIALIAHAKNGLLQKDRIAEFAIPAAAVCAVFSLIAIGSDDRMLSRGFGIFLAVLGAAMMIFDALAMLKDKLRLAVLAIIRRDLPYSMPQK